MGGGCGNTVVVVGRKSEVDEVVMGQAVPLSGPLWSHRHDVQPAAPHPFRPPWA